ncbi:unnamed protein product [Cunninghamella echinulata]
MVRAMFPDIPIAAIQADLQRTGSVETTVDNALRDGGLPMPAIPTPPSQPGSPSLNNNTSSSSSSSSRKATNHGSLLQRYKIDSQSLDEESLKEPPRVWESSAEKRQEILKKRKEFMVLQARKKLLEKQQETNTSSGENTSTTPTITPDADPNNNDIMVNNTGDNNNATTSSNSKTDNLKDLSVDELNALSPEERRKHMLQAYEKKQTTENHI